MKEKIEINDKKVFHEDYFADKPSPVLLMWIRLAFLCLMSGSLVSVFCKLYGFGGNIMIPVGITVGASVLIYMLAMLFPPVFVYSGVAAAGIGVIWIYRQQIYVGALYFWDHMMLKLNSRLLDTTGFFIHNKYKIMGGSSSEVLKMNTAFFWAAIIFAILTALVFTAAVRTKYKLFVPVAAVIIVTAPSVAAETASFLPDFLVYLVCVFGFSAISSSYDLDNGFIFGKGSTPTRMSARRGDILYRRRTRFFALKKRIDSDTDRYYRYTPNLVAAAALSAAVFFGASAVIPEGMGISYQKVFDTMAAVGTEVMDRIGEMFGTPLGTADDRNYFSDDEYGGISGSIGIDPPNSSNRAVLEVTLSRNDIPIYLRGDIGVDFAENAWTSVSSVADRYDAAVGDYFYPEAEYQVFRRFVRFSQGMEPDDVMPLQMVKVRYLRNTRVVFQPLAAFDLNYKSNGLYNYYGDFVLRTKSGFIGSYEGLSLTPNFCSRGSWTDPRDEMLLDNVLTGFTGVNEAAALRDGMISVPDMTNEVYMMQIEKYRGFIEQTYMNKGEPAIQQFVDDVRGFYTTSESAAMYSSYYPADNGMRYRYSQAICEYFSKNFTYSLEDDSPSERLGAFLYDTHKGHCALFATAMTLALREMDMPARYVTGYVVYPGSGTEQSDGSYRCMLSERMLHAWVEVYFRGVGWIPFDPTVSVPGYAEIVYGSEPAPDAPGAQTTPDPALTEPAETTTPAPVTSVSETTLVPENTAETTEDDTDSPAVTDADTGRTDPYSPAEHDEFAELMMKLLPFIVIALVVTAFVIIAVMFVKSVGKAEKKMFAGFHRMPPTEAASAMYRFSLKLLKIKRLEPENELMADFAERVDGSIEMKGSNAFMTDVVGIFEKCEFGNAEVSPVTEDERESVYRYTAAVYKKIISEMAAPKRFFTKISLFL